MTFNNPKDPLFKTGPERQAELLRQVGAAMHGYPIEDVISVAANLLVNALRKSYDKRDKAAPRFDEIAAKTKEILMNQYDSTGRLKGVYPYDQVIQAPLIVERSKIIPPG